MEKDLANLLAKRSRSRLLGDYDIVEVLAKECDLSALADSVDTLEQYIHYRLSNKGIMASGTRWETLPLNLRMALTTEELMKAFLRLGMR